MFCLNEWQKWKLSYNADCIIWALVCVPIIFKVFLRQSFCDSHFEYCFDILNMRAAHCVSHHFLRLCLYNYNTCVCVWFSLFLDRERLFDLPSFKSCLHFPSTFWVDFFFKLISLWPAECLLSVHLCDIFCCCYHLFDRCYYFDPEAVYSFSFIQRVSA